MSHLVWTVEEIVAARAAHNLRALQAQGGTRVTKIAAFHTDTVLAYYHPNERYVYHNQDGCQYCERIIKDGNKKDGMGTTPTGATRQLCDKCEQLA